jgi:CheY-like chemotaxis protein
MISGRHSIVDVHAMAERAGHSAEFYLAKPVTPGELLEAVQTILQGAMPVR